jgi:ATP-dependent DNA helicase HFM1/MER3
VVIKGVHTFQNNVSVEYSDLDVMQMLGRAVSETSIFNDLHQTTSVALVLGSSSIRWAWFANPTLSLTHCLASDKDGVAIILCENELEHKYRSLLQGKTILESSLHLNLSEHLNSEIGLGTISHVDSAKQWLHNSFLFRRIQKNPSHYALGKDDTQTWEERIDELVMQSVAKLQETQLVKRTTDGDAGLQSTEYGDIMSKASRHISSPFRSSHACL